MCKPMILFDLFLVRHGQSNGNAGICTGDSAADRQDALLSETGRRQAELLARRFSAVPLDAVFSSGLRRAVCTAQTVVLRQPPDGTHTVEILPLLAECDIREDYTGFSFEALRELASASAAAAGWDDPQTVLPNDEETDGAYNIDRAKRVLEYLFSRFHAGEQVMVVSHGIFNTILLMQALGVEPQRFDPDFDNTSVTHITFYRAGTGPWGFDVRLRTLNDTAHLGAEYQDHRGGNKA